MPDHIDLCHADVLLRLANGWPAVTAPWVVIAPVAAAVNVLERLHPGPLLFPNTLLTNGRAKGCLQARVGMGRSDQLLTKDTTALIEWINAYCSTTRREDTVPADPAHASIYPSRLRRTLAWFIVRRPRGLVAAAIQYGHVAVRATLGYSQARELHQMGEVSPSRLSCTGEGCECQTQVASDLAKVRIGLRVTPRDRVIDAEECLA